MTIDAHVLGARAGRQTFFGLVGGAVVSAMLLATSVQAYAQSATVNTIQSVTASIQGGSEIIRIDLAEPLKVIPTGFTVQSPARIALDFAGIGNTTTRSALELNLGNLRSANVVQAGERTRVVLNLRLPTAYKTEIQGKSLFITLEPATGGSAVASAAAPVFAENRNRDTLPLKDLDFRRGTDNAGRVVVDLANNQVGVDIRQQGQTLVVEFLKTALPEGLRRRLDVSDFGTPIQNVTTTQIGDRVRMVIEPKGQWEHSAYQSDNQFVVEVRQQKIDTTKLTQGVGFTGEKLSLNFQNIEIRSLLQVIADFTNFNVVTSDTVTGAVTLRLKDVPWDQALDIIMQAKSLGMRKNGNVLLIAPKDELAAKEKQELESKAALQGLEPLRSQSFQLNYAKAADIATQLLGSTSGVAASRTLSSRGSLISEARTNQLFVNDIPSKLEQVQQLIAKLDIPVRQVLIEARIVEASDSFGKSLGIRLGGSDLRGLRGGDAGYNLRGGNRVALGGTYNAVSSTTGESVGTLDTNNTTFLNLPALGQGGYSPATFAISLFSSAANRFLNLELSALEADGKGKLVSSPRIVTADQTKAIIEQGTEFPYQQATSSGATSLAFRKANLKLEVTPQITPEGSIILDLDINKDSRGETTAAGIAINTKHIKTQVLVENGGTVVIGGIFELTESDAESKVPLLGDLPALGNLFKTKTRNSTKSELLVFITPKMISDRTAVR